MEVLPPSIAGAIPCGATLARKAFARGIRPDPDLDVPSWMEDNLVLPSEVSPSPGKFRFAEAPHLEFPARLLNPSDPCDEVILKFSAQTAKTLLGIGWAGAIADKAPAPMGIYLPTVDVAKAYNGEKFDPIRKATPALARKISKQVSRDDQGSTIFMKRFPGGFIKIVGTNASAGLQMSSMKFQIKEEITEWLDDVDGRGDPEKQVDRATKAYRNSGAKCLTVSTPGTKGRCRVTKKWDGANQWQRFVPCPHCGEMQVLKWENFRWDVVDGAAQNTVYACEHNGCIIQHFHKRGMMQAGEWRMTKAGNPRKHAFEIWQAYSLMNGWDDIAQEFIDAGSDATKLKTFWQQTLGLAWEESGDAPPTDLLFARRENFAWRRIPPKALFLTGAADVQGDRIEWDVYAWGRDLESWLIDSGVIEGDPNDAETWAKLDAIISRKYDDFLGKPQQIDAFGIDTGFLSQKVYAYARRHAYLGRVFALDGRPGWKLPAIGTPTKRDIDFDGRKIGSVLLWPVGTWDQKAEMYSALNKTIEGPDKKTGLPQAGTAHFNEMIDKDYFDQLTAEALQEPKGPKGFKGAAIAGMRPKKWVKLRPRNERHDIGVYARALAHHLSDAMSKADWDALELARGTAPEAAQADMAAIWAQQPAAVAQAVAAELRQAEQPVEAPAPKVNRFTGRGSWLGRR